MASVSPNELPIAVLEMFGLPKDKCISVNIKMDAGSIPVLQVEYAVLDKGQILKTLEHYGVEKKSSV